MADNTTPWMAQRLVTHLRETDLDALPPEMVHKTKMHVLDFLGSLLACVSLPDSQPVRDYVARHGAPGTASAVGTARTLDPEYAAMLNAAVGHGFEMDDYAPRATTHPSCQVIPAALAVAEELDSSGRELLHAIALGFETCIRLGLATMPSMLVERGFHEGCAHAVVASSAALGTLAGLDGDRQVTALSIGVSHASGTTEFANTGGTVKRLHPGLGAMGAIRAMRLAQAGVTAPPSIFEGPRGYFHAFSPNPHPDALLDAWGERWEFLRYGALKPYACMGSIHGHIDAMAKLRGAGDFAAADVAEIVMGCDWLALSHAGRVGPEPEDMIGAQFSGEYNIALNLVKGGNDIAVYQAAAAGGFADPGVLAVSRRTRMVHDQSCESTGPASSLGKVTVVLKDGTTRSAQAYGTGTPANPMSYEQIEAKYHALASRSVSRELAEKAADAVVNLEKLPKAREIGEVIRRAG